MCLERFSLRRGISFSFLASEAAYVIISEARNLITDVGVRCAGETQHEGGWAALLLWRGWRRRLLEEESRDTRML